MKMPYASTIILSIALSLFCSAPQAFAQTFLGADTISGTTALVSGNGGLTLGWQFQVTAPAGIIVNGLGFWDYQSNGFSFNQAFDVGLWNSSTGTLLQESVITSSSTLVPSTDTAGGWRVNAVLPLYLAPGFYTIGALMPTNGANQIAIDPQTYQTGSGISLIGFVRQIGSPTLAMPDIGPPYPTASWFGPTFTYSPVPEPPGSSFLIVGFGLLSAFCVFKRTIPVSTDNRPKKTNIPLQLPR